jgi:hypothetical protein
MAKLGWSAGAKSLLHRIFRHETMDGGGRCPVYLERWTIARAFGCAIYLYHFLGDDWSIDPHDHPRRFISVGLKGWYDEDLFDANGNELSTRRYKAPWFRSFPATHIHRVRAAECGNTWTLVMVLPKCRDWGFIRDGKWMPFRDYVFGGKARKSC